MYAKVKWTDEGLLLCGKGFHVTCNLELNHERNKTKYMSHAHSWVIYNACKLPWAVTVGKEAMLLFAPCHVLISLFL